MKQVFSTCLLVLLSTMAGNAQAWWGTPYGGQWPNAWPQPYAQPYAQPGFYPDGVHRWQYGGPDWNMRGYMTEWGDVNVVIEYRGNMNNDFFGGNRGYPGYGGYGPYQQPPFYGWR